jgi:hypothetical protein
MKLVRRLLDTSVLKLTRAACIFALLGLGLMSYSILDARAIPVITAMSVGHAFGIGAFACYVLAVVLDARRNARATSTAAPAPVTGHSVALPQSPVADRNSASKSD